MIYRQQFWQSCLFVVLIELLASLLHDHRPRYLASATTAISLPLIVLRKKSLISFLHLLFIDRLSRRFAIRLPKRNILFFFIFEKISKN
jgi:G:T-mismatch repair DNA endonuclease (very short patch repair protein)